MDKRISQIKQKMKKECFESNKNKDWFFNSHLLVVEKNAKFLLSKMPDANKEVVMLDVWLHDLQHIREIKGDHEKVGAGEAENVLKEFKYNNEIIRKVKEIILTHSCANNRPKSVEGKILATADAMSHYYGDFYLLICAFSNDGVKKYKDLKRYKEWSLKKLVLDYDKKIFFSFAREKIKERHEILFKLFTMN